MMNKRMHFLTALCALAGTIYAQTEAPAPAPDPEATPAAEHDLGLKRTIDTIAAVDAQFQANQAEVLGETSDEPVVEPEATPEVEPTVEPEPGIVIESSTVVEAATEVVEGAVEAIAGADDATDETAESTTLPGTIEMAGPAEGSTDVVLEDEGLPALPDVIDSGDLSVDEVFIEDDAPVEGSMELVEDTISVDFPDEDVRQIVRNVADLYELNVVIPETLVGSVSIKLRDVSWRQVFDVVLEPLNFTWVEDGNIIKIKSIDDLLAEPVTTRVFIINYATAGEIQGSIAPMVDASAGGRLQVDTRSNALVITERPSRMNDIQAIIDRLDRPTDQVMIESKFVEVTQRDEKNLGINWAALNGFEVSAGPFSRRYDNEDSLSHQNRLDLENTLSSGNSSQAQLGTDFDVISGERSIVNTDLDESFSSSGMTQNGLRSAIATMSESRIDTALFNADQFKVILSALETNNDVELVSNPTVVTMNNTVAQINIGEEFPIPEYRYNDERGTFEVAGFDYKPIGILLNVVPQVNSAGFINLAIKPEISSRTGEVNFGGAGGAAIPIVTTRKTESTVTIKSGYTLAIGGLMETQTGKTENKVPLLGDIPFIGRAFRSNTDTVDGRNLIIFITAKVLNPDGSTYRDVFDDRDLIEMGISHRDVPGYEADPEEQALFEQLQSERDRLEQSKSETHLKKQLAMLEKLREQAAKAEEARLEREFNERLREWERTHKE